MLNWLRRLFENPARAPSRALTSYAPPATNKEQQSHSIPLTDLYVEPDETEDFDPSACERLMETIRRAGASTVDDVCKYTCAVSLEDFFEGNRCKHSLAANVQPAAPFDTAGSWYDLLRKIRSTTGVSDVLVVITMIEPYEGGRVGIWPYADAIWIYSSLDRDEIAALVAPLEPSEVRDASLTNANWNLKPPYPRSGSANPFWVWWD
jgi:hypothetical protein